MAGVDEELASTEALMAAHETFDLVVCITPTIIRAREGRGTTYVFHDITGLPSNASTPIGFHPPYNNSTTAPFTGDLELLAIGIGSGATEDPLEIKHVAVFYGLGRGPISSTLDLACADCEPGCFFCADEDPPELLQVTFTAGYSTDGDYFLPFIGYNHSPGTAPVVDLGDGFSQCKFGNPDSQYGYEICDENAQWGLEVDFIYGRDADTGEWGWYILVWLHRCVGFSPCGCAAIGLDQSWRTFLHFVSDSGPLDCHSLDITVEGDFYVSDEFSFPVSFRIQSA